MRFFKIGWVPAVAAVLGIALTVALGNWQMRRAGQKEALQQTLDKTMLAEVRIVKDKEWQQPASLIHAELFVRGEWLPHAVIYLDNRPYQGRAGFYVLMPLKLEPSGIIVMVNRGWLPRSVQDRTALAPYVTPKGVIELTALALAEEPRLFELGQGEHKPGGIWQNFDPELFQRVSGLGVVPLVLRQSEATKDEQQDGLIRDWHDQGLALQSQIDRHHGYAAQWYGLAALIAFLTLFYGYRNARKPDPALN